MSDNVLWHRLECPCNPDFRYKTSETFDNHFASQRHRLYESQKRCREFRIQTGLLETNNRSLNASNRVLQSQYDRLNTRLAEETTRSQSLRTALEDMKDDRARWSLRYIRAIFESHRQYRRLDTRLAEETTRSQSLRTALENTKNDRARWAGKYIAHWVRARVRLRRMRARQWRRLFDQCLGHLVHYLKYRRALDRCYDIISGLS